MRFTKNTQHDTSKVLRLPRKMTMDTSKVLHLPRKMQHIFWKRRKSIAPATQNDFRHVTKHVWMSRSATPATRNEATRRLKPPKMTTSAELTIGTAIRGSRERLRTVANGCERLRTVATVNATSSEHTLNPQTPTEWNGNPCYAFGKKGELSWEYHPVVNQWTISIACVRKNAATWCVFVGRVFDFVWPTTLRWFSSQMRHGCHWKGPFSTGPSCANDAALGESCGR